MKAIADNSRVQRAASSRNCKMSHVDKLIIPKTSFWTTKKQLAARARQEPSQTYRHYQVNQGDHEIGFKSTIGARLNEVRNVREINNGDLRDHSGFQHCDDDLANQGGVH